MARLLATFVEVVEVNPLNLLWYILLYTSHNGFSKKFYKITSTTSTNAPPPLWEAGFSRRSKLLQDFYNFYKLPLPTRGGKPHEHLHSVVPVL